MATKKPVEEVGDDQVHPVYIGQAFKQENEFESTQNALSLNMETRERGTGATGSFEMLDDTFKLPSPKSQHRKSPEGSEEEDTYVQQLEKEIRECNDEKQKLMEEIECLKQKHTAEQQKLQHDLHLAKETIVEARVDKDQLTEVLEQKHKQMRDLEEKIKDLCEEKDQRIKSLERKLRQKNEEVEQQAKQISELSNSHLLSLADDETSKLQLSVQSMQVSDIDGVPSEGLVTGAIAKLPQDQIDKLKKYIITAQKFRQLGVGTYGTVWELLIDGTKKAAGKEFRTYDAPVSCEQQVAKFCKEVHILLGLDHEHIVSYLGICSVHGSTSFLPMLVMELLKTNLHDYLLDDSHRPSPSTKVTILLGISNGLDYLHAKGVLHRDLTAKNVLLTCDTVAKISDFGNSTIIDSDVTSESRLESMTPIPGTLLYMPPEAESGTYSFALDIFSFGHLALFTITRKYLRSLPAAKFYEGNECKGCSEVDRRCKSFDIMNKQLGEDHILVSLITKCLDDVAANRPSAETLSHKLNDSKLWTDRHEYTVRLFDEDIN